MKIQYNGSSKILKRLVELVNRSQNVALRQDNTDKNTLYWTGLDGVEITVNIPVPEKVSELENDAGYGTYTKPAAGIPKSDLASGVQASLGKADTALQKHQDISGKVDNTAAGADSLLSKITNSWTAAPTDNTYFIRQDTSSKNEFGRVKFSTLWSYIKSKVESLGYTKNTGTITGIKMNGASKGTSGVVDLGTVITAHQDISGKQDKSTAVTHSANTAVGSATKPVYIAANGAATAIPHSINSDVPENAKFTDTTYNDATQSAHGLMTAADKKKLDGIAAGATKVAVDSALSATSTNPVQNKAVKAALDSKSASGHTHAMITNSALWVSGANNTAKWVKLGTLVSSGNFSNAMIRVWSGDGANGRANQNSSFEVQIKDGWQSTESATKACGVTVYRISCSDVKVKVIPTAHDTYTVWAYMPWGYWNGNYAVYGKYKSWTDQHLIQSEEPEGTGADTAYYDQAFLTSTVANATTWDGLINDVDTYNSSDTWILVKKDNRIQHRYAGELDVNSAKTLTDSGWVTCPLAVTGNTTYPSSSSIIKVRKYGKLVRLEAAVKYKTAFGTGHNVATIPEGYRPSVLQREHGITSTATEKIWFDATLGVGGNLSFAPAGNSSYEFNPANSYECRMTYFID
jgi:hypothetical protein